MDWLGGLFGGLGAAASAKISAQAQREANETNLLIADRTNRANFEIAQMNNDYNTKMLERQIGYNTEMWNKQNEYNKASNQAKRLLAAGINPAMSMSGSNAGTASSAGGISPQGAVTPTMQSATVQPVDGWSTLFQRMGEYASMFENIKGMRLDNYQKEINAKFAERKILSELALMKANTKGKDIQNSIDEMTKNVYGDILQNNLVEQRNRITMQEWDIKMKQAQVFQEELRAFALPQQLSMSISEQAVRINNAVIQGRLTEQQARHEYQKTLKTMAETQGIKLNNKVLEQTTDALVNTAKYNEELAKYNAQYREIELEINRDTKTSQKEAKHNEAVDNPLKLLNSTTKHIGKGFRNLVDGRGWHGSDYFGQ